MTHSPDLSFSFSFLSLFSLSLSLSLRVGVAKQPDEQSICMSFAEKVKQTPAVGSGELEEGARPWSRNLVTEDAAFFWELGSLGSVGQSWPS